jgi:AcrR family transcriptional regulator
MPTPQPGLRPPQQRRSRESLERVLVAGENLLATKGYEGFTVGEVSRKAKVSVGSVYGRFENKDALILAIHRRQMDRMVAAAAEEAAAGDADAERDLAHAVSHAVHALADGMERERALLRVFMLRGAVDEAIRRSGSEASRAVARTFKDAVLARRDEIAHPDPELAVDVSFRMAYDILARRVLYGPTFESELEIPWPVLVDQLIVAALAYLRSGRDAAEGAHASSPRKRPTARRKSSRSVKR